MSRFRPVDYLSINVYWFALSHLWNSLHPTTLPVLVPLMAPESLKGSALGIMTSVGLILAVIVQPAAGAISDKSTSRWGRRRAGQYPRGQPKCQSIGLTSVRACSL